MYQVWFQELKNFTHVNKLKAPKAIIIIIIFILQMKKLRLRKVYFFPKGT